MARPVFMHIYRRGSADQWAIHVRNIKEKPMQSPNGMRYIGYLFAHSADKRTDIFVQRFLSQMANSQKFPTVPDSRIQETEKTLEQKVGVEKVNAMSWDYVATQGETDATETAVAPDFKQEFGADIGEGIIVVKNKIKRKMEQLEKESPNWKNLKNFDIKLDNIIQQLRDETIRKKVADKAIDDLIDIVDSIGGMKRESFKHMYLKNLLQFGEQRIVNKLKIIDTVHDITTFKIFLERVEGEGKGFLSLFITRPTENVISMGVTKGFLNYITKSEDGGVHDAFSLVIGGHATEDDIRYLVFKADEKGIQVPVSADDDVPKDFVPTEKGAGFSGYFRGEDPETEKPSGVYQSVKTDVEDKFGQRTVKPQGSFAKYYNKNDAQKK